MAWLKGVERRNAMTDALGGLTKRPAGKTRLWQDGGSSCWRMLLLTCCSLALAGCSRTVTWQEEVQLSDGRIIVVERETLRDIGGPELALGGSGTSPKERRIRFEYPFESGQQVEWRSIKMSGLQWPEIPLILDIQVNVPYVITLNSGNGCLYYSKYIYRNEAWSEETLGEQIAPRKSNLLLKSGPQMAGFVNLFSKENENSDIRYDKSMRIVGPARSICGANTPTRK